MKTSALATIAFLALVACATFKNGDINVASSPTADVFVGTSPCTDFVKPKLQIPGGENCDRIKWRVSLSDSGKYELTREWGFHIDNRTYLPKGTTNFSGTWKLAKGRSGDPNGIVVQLDGDKPNSIGFALIDQGILHLLDPNKDLAVGDSGASYTLNRTQKSTALPNGTNGAATESDLTPAINFSGRSPCREIANEIKHAVESDCFKLKWTIDFFRDPKTLIPTTYRLRGTLYRNEARGTETIREGRWQVTKGTKTDPNAIVYELDAFGSDGPILLLKADRNVLFFLANDRSVLIGNEDFSYTLNRGKLRPVTVLPSKPALAGRTAL
jgi:hypothetical protein